MMLFRVGESAQTTADEDAAVMVAVKSWVDQMTEREIMVHGGTDHPGQGIGSVTRGAPAA